MLRFLVDILKYLIGLLVLAVLYFGLILAYPFAYAGYLSPTTAPASLGHQMISGSGQGSLKVTVIGDSTALGQGSSSQLDSFSYQYVQKYLSSKYQQIDYINYSTSGNKISDVVNNQLSEVQSDSPDLVFVSIGANDVTALTDKNTFASEEETIINSLKNLKSKVIWMSIPDFVTSPILLPPLNTFLSNQASQFNQITKDSLSGTGFSYVDVFDSTRQPFIDMPDKYFAKDKYHPSQDGYSLWVEQINKVMNPIY
jgi:lysophospholipase L1-like esterase